eukprot:TRINITY_DN23965_c0_g1_i1.p1 TRINITY_DN23965_c0_g1~~TRINITY_DN23965_c0_g1_i1.p1  ORF type:complete len:249 (+),score=69.52 TRINITY_DN23965_c0_g1_i1:37-783(+)
MGFEPDQPVAPPAPIVPEPVAVAGEPEPETAPVSEAPVVAAAPQPVVAPSAVGRSVAVTGLSQNVTPAMVEEFMLFCGEVEKVEIKPDSSAQHCFLAIVIFADATSVEDALILTGAVVGDSTVTISNLDIVNSDPDAYDVVAEKATKASDMVQKVIKAGYINGTALAGEIKAKAVALDEKHKIVDKTKEADIPGKAKAVAGAVGSYGVAVKDKITGKPRDYTEEEKQEFINAGSRQWTQNTASTQPQW